MELRKVLVKDVNTKHFCEAKDMLTMHSTEKLIFHTKHYLPPICYEKGDELICILNTHILKAFDSLNRKEVNVLIYDLEEKDVSYFIVTSLLVSSKYDSVELLKEIEQLSNDQKWSLPFKKELIEKLEEMTSFDWRQYSTSKKQNENTLF